MPLVRRSRRGCSRRRGDCWTTYLAFGIIALANTVLPFIIFSSNYLIIPYPRPVVILIETVPALTTKLLLPHVIHRVPYWIRPLCAASIWTVLAIVTRFTPPNVSPPLRASTSMLASATAAATDVSMLGMMRYYDGNGLAGWAAGTGAGGLLAAVLPYIVAVWMRSFLRKAIGLVYYLTGATLFAYFVILPRAPMDDPNTRHEHGKDLEGDQEASESLLVEDPTQGYSSPLSGNQRLALVRDLMQQFILPLAVAAGTQALTFPGVSRALPKSGDFQTFFLFSTSYGFLLQLGNFISRSLAMPIRLRSTNALFLISGLAVFALLANATFALFSSHMLIGMVVFCIGLMGGAIYVTTVTKLIEDKSSEPGPRREACLQTVGFGEAVGVMLGGLTSTVIEAVVCTIGVGSLLRWCDGPY